ncbi:MAG: hypothetical protein R2834_08375 [Rhodothermales bacterium]
MTSARPLFARLARYFTLLFHRSLTDRQIAGFLAELFESDMEHTQAEALRFYVKRRIVTIYGTLYRAMDHEHVIKLTARIPGLEAIVDRINVVEDVHREELNARVVLLLNDTYAPSHLLPA